MEDWSVLILENQFWADCWWKDYSISLLHFYWLNLHETVDLFTSSRDLIFERKLRVGTYLFHLLRKLEDCQCQIDTLHKLVSVGKKTMTEQFHIQNRIWCVKLQESMTTGLSSDTCCLLAKASWMLIMIFYILLAVIFDLGHMYFIL